MGKENITTESKSHTDLHNVVVDDNKITGAKNWDVEKYAQSEVAYNVYSTNAAQVCANCRWFISESDWKPCHIVENEPLPIVSGGWCNEWQQNPKAIEMAYPEIEIEIEGDLLIGEMSAKDLLSKMWQTKSIKPLQDYVKSIFSDNHLPDTFGISGFKSLDDNKWLAWFTNNFEDKESELFTDKAIATFTKRCNDGLLPYPELWYYHIKGTSVGRATKLFHVGHFLVALGEWDSKAENKKVEPIQKWSKDADIRLSHGFFYDEKMKHKGVYHDFATFEITLLDNGVEANPYTTFSNPVSLNEVTKIMTVSEVQKKALYSVFDEALADEIVKAASEGGKALENAGIAYKAAMDSEDEKDPKKKKEDDDDMSKEGKILLAAIGQSHKAMENRVAALEALVKPDNKANDNLALLNSFDSQITDIETKMNSLISEWQKFARMTPRASKSGATQISDNDAQANHIHQQMYEQGKPKVKGLIQGIVEDGKMQLSPDFPANDDMTPPPFQNGNS
jgi:hypothetical protein